MELNISKFLQDIEPHYYSASVAELGNDAGEITWQNAIDRAEFVELLATDEQRQSARDWFAEFGAWSEDEIAAWNDTELTALLIQFISGEVRELGELATDNNPNQWKWDEIEELQKSGTVSGNIFRGNDDEFYYYMGV